LLLTNIGILIAFDKVVRARAQKGWLVRMRDKPKEGMDLNEILKRLHIQTRRLMDKGAGPAELSFALTYIATELGFVLAPNPLSVLPVVLNAIPQAASNRLEAMKPTEGKEKMDLQAVQPGETIH
jgi:hypothetical protein